MTKIKFNIKEHKIIEFMTLVKLPCSVEIITKRSKYYGKIFTVKWPPRPSVNDWYISVVNNLIDRTYEYLSCNVKISNKSIKLFNKTLDIHSKLDLPLDYFNRPINLESVIFLDNALYRVTFIIALNSPDIYINNIGITCIDSKSRYGDKINDIIFVDEFSLQKSIIIDDPLLLLKV